ncbi:PREDICTED: uncharacterized protein LOC109477745 [Branchiostoma belcheri]|uniref:Uncharacterized protein LOC109477745 n=1 Tax=Branchiostoma belcheri TaxID=7741 RepID=A0A6P4YZB7_BRABE|nr:PREDICTED: uncharacterized protein LOC109477745 [Branchiostoma belcheri]
MALTKRNIAGIVLFCLALLSADKAMADRVCFPGGCEAVVWPGCVPYKVAIRHEDGSGTCIQCEGERPAVDFLNQSTSCWLDLHVYPAVALRGYTFGALSITKLPRLPAYPDVTTLVLVHDKITQMEENSLSVFSNLHTLVLDFNELTYLKQGWFIGLGGLAYLSLSNNKLEQIDHGCFKHMTKISWLNLENNHLHTIDRAWFDLLPSLNTLFLEGNKIHNIPPNTFENLYALSEIHLTRNSLYCLDFNVTRQGSRVQDVFSAGGDRLMTVHDEKPQKTKWDFYLDSSSQLNEYSMYFETPNFGFCFSNVDSFSNDVILMWDFRSVITASPTGTESPGLASLMDCHTESMDYSSVQKLDSSDSPFVAIATDDIPSERTLNYPDMCRHAWENNVGVTVALGSSASMQVVSLGVGSTTDTAIAITFIKTHNTETGVKEEILNTRSDTSDTYNITCILISKYGESPLFSNISSVTRKIHKTCPTVDRSVDTDQTSTTTLTTEDYRYHTPRNQTSTTFMHMTTHMQVTTPKRRTSAQGFSIPAVVSVVVVVFLIVFVGSLLKMYQLKLRNDDRDAQVRTHTGLVGLARFPHVLDNIQYDGNPDHVAAAQRPLPALPPPYWEIRHKAAALPHLYTEIPDHIAAAQRPLPTLPLTPTDNTIPTVSRSTGYNKFNTLPLTHHSDRDSHDRAELHRSLPSLHHSLGAPDCDSDSPDDDTVRFYAAAAEPPPLLTATRAQGNPSLRTYQDSSVGIFTAEPPPLPTATRTQGNPRTYQESSIGIFHNHQFGASRRHVLYNAHGLPRYNSVTPYGAIDIYCPEGMLGEGALSGVTWRRSLPVRPYVNWSRQISRENPEEEGCPEIFIPPKTYWPWEITGEVTRNTPRRASFPLILPNTYWPWEIPREEP